MKYILMFFIAIFFVACGGGGGGSGSSSNAFELRYLNSDLRYDTEQNGVTGVVSFSADGFSTKDLGELKINNIEARVVDCGVSDIRYDHKTFTYSKVEDINLSIDLDSKCEANKLTLKVDTTSKKIDLSNPLKSNISTNSYSYVLDISSQSGDDLTAISKSYNIALDKNLDSISTNSLYELEYKIYDKDLNIVPSSEIEYVNIRTLDSTYAILSSNGSEKMVLDFYSSSDSFSIKSSDTSGIFSFDIELKIKGQDVVKKSYSLTVVKSVTTAMSINYKSTRYEAPYYIDSYVLNVVDNYGNPSFDGDSVSLGLVSNVKKSSSDGVLEKIGNDYVFSSSIDLTSGIDSDDRLVIYPNATQNEPRNLGYLNIESIDTTRDLIYVTGEKFLETNLTNLSFVIGDERLYNSCQNTVSIATLSSDDYKIKDGKLEFELKYEPYMVAKPIYIYANLETDSTRVGSTLGYDLIHEDNNFTAGLVPVQISKSGGSYRMGGDVRNSYGQYIENVTAGFQMTGLTVNNGVGMYLETINIGCNGDFVTSPIYFSAEQNDSETIEFSILLGFDNGVVIGSNDEDITQ